MNKLFIAIAALGCATPALAQTPTERAADRFETAYIGLSAVDVASTIYCLDHVKGCEESNPLFGKHPKAWMLIGAKVAGTALQYYIYREIKHKDAHMALRVAQVSVGLQGAVVGLNMKVIF